MSFTSFRANVRILIFAALAAILVSSSSCSTGGSLFAPGDEIDYKVKAGDTLFIIARRYDISMMELQTRNRLADPRKLKIGQTLRVRVSGADRHAIYGGPYVSAEQAKKQREDVTFPPTKTLGVSMSRPIGAARVGSPFGVRGARFHEGIDLVACEGTPIYAAHDGLVIFSGERLSGYGNMVALQQGQVMTVYAHTSENLVQRGQIVKRGTEIAKVGATGRATGPHLHFEVRVKASNDRYYAVEPADFIDFH